MYLYRYTNVAISIKMHNMLYTGTNYNIILCTSCMNKILLGRYACKM